MALPSVQIPLKRSLKNPSGPAFKRRCRSFIFERSEPDHSYDTEDSLESCVIIRRPRKIIDQVKRTLSKKAYKYDFAKRAVSTHRPQSYDSEDVAAAGLIACEPISQGYDAPMDVQFLDVVDVPQSSIGHRQDLVHDQQIAGISGRDPSPDAMDVDNETNVVSGESEEAHDSVKVLDKAAIQRSEKMSDDAASNVAGDDVDEASCDGLEDDADDISSNGSEDEADDASSDGSGDEADDASPEGSADEADTDDDSSDEVVEIHLDSDDESDDDDSLFEEAIKIEIDSRDVACGKLSTYSDREESEASDATLKDNNDKLEDGLSAVEFSTEEGSTDHSSTNITDTAVENDDHDFDATIGHDPLNQVCTGKASSGPDKTISDATIDEQSDDVPASLPVNLPDRGGNVEHRTKVNSAAQYGADDEAENNSAIQLHELSRDGRDGVSLLQTPKASSLNDWSGMINLPIALGMLRDQHVLHPTNDLQKDCHDVPQNAPTIIAMLESDFVMVEYMTYSKFCQTWEEYQSNKLDIMHQAIPALMGPFDHVRYGGCPQLKFEITKFGTLCAQPYPDRCWGSPCRKVNDKFDDTIRAFVDPICSDIDGCYKNRPLGCNFFLEVHDPNDGPSTDDANVRLLDRRIATDGWVGSRAMLALKGMFPPVDDTVHDVKDAHTLVATFVEDILTFYACWAEFCKDDARFDFRSCQVGRYDLLKSEKEYLGGVRAFINARNWTHQQRQEAFEQAHIHWEVVKRLRAEMDHTTDWMRRLILD